MPPTINVTIDEVRTALNGISDSYIPDATVQQAIEAETLIVLGQLPEGWDNKLTERLEGTAYDPVDAVELLVRRRAARNAFHSTPTEVRRQALDAVISMDIQAFRGLLNQNVEDIYDLLDLSRGGNSAAFVDATRHAPPDDDPYS